MATTKPAAEGHALPAKDLVNVTQCKTSFAYIKLTMNSYL